MNRILALLVLGNLAVPCFSACGSDENTANGVDGGVDTDTNGVDGGIDTDTNGADGGVDTDTNGVDGGIDTDTNSDTDSDGNLDPVNLDWIKQTGGAEWDYGIDIVVLQDETFITTGFFTGTGVFGAGGTNVTTVVSAGSSDIFAAKYDSNGALVWVRTDGGTGNDESRGICDFPDGSFLTTGIFEGTALFGADEPNQITLISSGENDIFIARYQADGLLAWAKQAGGQNRNAAVDISALSDGSALITGTFSGELVLGAGEATQTTLTSAGDSDIFVAKYAPNGSLVWAKRSGGIWVDSGTSLTVLPDDTFIAGGMFSETATFGIGEMGETSLVSLGGMDIYWAKYNKDGTLMWVKQAGGTSSEWHTGLSILPDKGFIATGFFYETAVFGLGEPLETELTAVGEWDIYLAKFDPDGRLVWAKRAGGPDYDNSHAIATWADGSCLITGDFSQTAVFGPGETNVTTLTSAGGSDVFIARYRPDGTLAWARREGGANIFSDGAKSVAPLPNGSFLLIGNFSDTAIFGAGEPNETALTSFGDYDLFVAKYSP